MEGEDYVKKEEVEFPKELLNNPYEYICEWAEDRLTNTGRKIFSVLSLMPCSLILPDFIINGVKTRSNMNVLFLAPPSGGKSTTSKILSELSFSPISLRSITPAKLLSKINNSPFFTLIVEDYSTMSQDPVAGKIIEGILGEEKRIQRATMRGEIDATTQGVGLLCGVPTDLQEHLSSGLIFRLIPIIIFHTVEEQSEIGKKISDGVGEHRENGFEEKENNIKNYYSELFKIQAGNHPTLHPIIGYNIPKEFSKKAYDTWNKLIIQIYEKIKAPFEWHRSLHEFWRILLSHAFLNVFNRKVEDGILYPNEDDLKVALRIMKEDLRIKYRLISSDFFIRSISTLRELHRIMNSEKISEEQKQILNSLVRVKNGKVYRRE